MISDTTPNSQSAIAPTVNPIPLHFETRTNSSSQDIFFVHGNLASLNWWHPVMDICENLFSAKSTSSKEKLSGKMIAMDLRGHGKSANPTTGKLQIESMMADLISLAEKSNLKNALVVGHSAGGLLSALLVARRPDLFSKLLLIDPASPTGLKNVPADIEEKYAMMTNNRAVAEQIISLTIHGNDPSKEFFKTKIMDDTMLALQNVGVGFVKALQGIDYTAEVAKIKVPMIVFHGKHDWVLDEQSAKDYCDAISSAKLVNLPDNGHCLNYENPERLAQEILNFIQS